MAVRLPGTFSIDASVNGWSTNMQEPSPVLPWEYPARISLSNHNAAQPGTSEESYVPVPEFESTGLRIRAPHDDWYYRLHFLPPSLALGNLSGDALRTLFVWNANFEAVTIEDFDIVNGQGVAWDSDITVPGEILPLKLAQFDFTISANGPPVLDATAVWTIDGETYEVSITGRRVTLFPFRPNWNGGLKETYTWKSSLQTTYSGKEQRMNLVTNPRRSFVYNIRERGNAAALFDVLIFGWQGRLYSHPMWHEASKLTADVAPGALVLPVDTTYMTLRIGSSVLVMRTSQDYEILQVQTFDAASITLEGATATAWPRGSRVWPMVAAAMDSSLNTSRPSPRYLDAAVRFTASPIDLTPHVPNIPADAVYLGEELYLGETNWRTSMPVSIQPREIRTDNGFGPIRTKPRATFPLITRRFSWMNKTKSTALFLLGFFGRRQGITKPVWIASGTDDFYVSGHVNAADVSVPVLLSEYASLIDNHPARKHVLFIMRDGTRYAREIQSVTNVGAGSVINLVSGLGVAFDPEDVKRVSYLGLYRLGSDEVTFEWLTDEVSEVDVNFVLTEPSE